MLAKVGTFLSAGVSFSRYNKQGSIARLAWLCFASIAIALTFHTSVSQENEKVIDLLGLINIARFSTAHAYEIRESKTRQDEFRDSVPGKASLSVTVPA